MFNALNISMSDNIIFFIFNYLMMPSSREMSSMRWMGRTARSAMPGSTSISGAMNLSELYNFSRVINFIYSHSLQAQVPSSGGAGIKVLLGQRRCISNRMPLSVHTMNSWLSLSTA